MLFDLKYTFTAFKLLFSNFLFLILRVTKEVNHLFYILIFINLVITKLQVAFNRFINIKINLRLAGQSWKIQQDPYGRRNLKLQVTKNH